jgi:UDP-3-O-[3-hydroxymyristoyl] N-acetylglucosamine deacetylase
MNELEANYYQRTVQREIECTGVGLHTGDRVHLKILPAPANSGIRFVRVDLKPRVEIPARIENVVASTLATTLGKNGATVATVEHLLATFLGMGIDNAIVEIDGGEVPILDGSAAPYVFLIKEAGVRRQRALKRFLVVRRQIGARLSGKAATLFPAKEFKISYRVDFDHPMVTDQRLTMTFSARSFQRDICRARTFGFLRDVEALKERGLARGGSLDNAIVLDEFRVLNADGLRFQDEFVRHKILDGMGDLSLVGMPVIGHLAAVCSGHDLNHRLVRKLLATPHAYQVVVPSEQSVLEELAISLPAFGLAEPEAVPG